MKLFNLEEANALLPSVRLLLESIQRAHRRVAAFRSEAQRAAEGAEQGGGGMPGGSRYITVLFKLGQLTHRLETMGAQIKDYERGLVDFPTLRDGRVVLLCWQLGEGDEIEWWHDTDSGFAGRQPL